MVRRTRPQVRNCAPGNLEIPGSVQVHRPGMTGHLVARQFSFSIATATPWPTPTHMVASASLPPRFFHAVDGGEREARAAHAEGMAERDGAAMRIDEIGIVGNAELAHAGDALRGEGFVQLDQVEIADLLAEALHQLACRRHRADAHDARRHAGRGEAEDAGARSEAMLLHGSFRGQDDRGRAVIDAGGVAGGHGAGIAHDRLQFCQTFERRLRAWMLVLVDRNRAGLAAGNGDRRDFLGEITRRDRRARALLRADGEGVLVGARDLEFLGDVLAGLRHGVDAILRLQQRIDETPADGGVEDLGGARECFLRLAHHEGRAGHGFDAASDRKLDLAGPDGAAGRTDRVQARGAEPVQGLAGNRIRQAREQQGHARDVAVVLAGLVGAAEEDFVDLCPIEIGVLGHQRLDRGRREVVGAHLGERAAETADRGPHGIADKDVTHRCSP
ncbi:hypothetical protein ABIF20_007420 [Bradyrhizobium japonicum]